MGTFLFFLFSFLCAYKKHKNAKQTIFTLSEAFKLSLLVGLACGVFLFFLCLRNLFVKKILWLKIVLASCAFAWLRLCAFGAFGAREIFL